MAKKKKRWRCFPRGSFSRNCFLGTLLSAFAFVQAFFLLSTGFLPVEKKDGGAAFRRAREEVFFEDNCPRPPPRANDREYPPMLPLAVLPGRGSERLHGDLGAATGWVPRPAPSWARSAEQLWTAHMGQCYDAERSDAVPLDRRQPERRSYECMRLANDYSSWDLPKASVVIVFHNEILTMLLRSVHSVLNQSPPDLLEEVILLDDASFPEKDRFTHERWEELQRPLEEHVAKLPKVRLVRLGDRRGLMIARMEGVWRASGPAVVFLDSHIEASPGWLEPLMARIFEDPRVVVVPAIGMLEHDTLEYSSKSGLGVLSFSWTLGQVPEPAGSSSKPAKSPIMAGGLFASHRGFFLHLGGYDGGMRYYGGEEMEIGFRTWQCDGSIELIPCSHVFHAFRSCDHWHGTNSGGVAYFVPGLDITRNKLRTAAVWLDEYAKLVEYASPALSGEFLIGNVDDRVALRKNLKCKNFSWYLRNVATQVNVPEITGLRAGALRSVGLEACLDTLNSKKMLGLYPCHGHHGTQAFVLDGDGFLRPTTEKYLMCVDFTPGDRTISLGYCGSSTRDDPRGVTRWLVEEGPGPGLLKLRASKPGAGKATQCLQASAEPTSESPHSVAVSACDPDDRMLHWTWVPW